MAVRMQHPLAEVERMFNRLERDWTGGLSIPMDAYTKEDAFHLRFDLPGVSSDQIDLTTEKSVLTLTVSRPVEVTDDDVIWSVRERPTGKHTRQIRVGDMADLSRIEADYRNGVLAVTIPLREEVKPRKISIAVDEQAELEASKT